MGITADIQTLEPSAIIDLYELDLSVFGQQNLFFHAGVSGVTDVDGLNLPVYWKGQPYTPFPIEAEGFAKTSKGVMPRPLIKVANVTGFISKSCKDFGDLVGSKITRRRTFVKYLDAVNFELGNPTADPNVAFIDEVWFIDRKSAENPVFVEFELSSAFDVSGVMVPRRQAIQNVCTWKYRSPQCGYAGGPVANNDDTATSSPTADNCGKRLHSCELRWGVNAELPYGGFPATGLIT